MERDALLQSLPLHILQGSKVQEPPLQVPLIELPPSFEWDVQTESQTA
jgi:hypothetical protein